MEVTVLEMPPNMADESADAATRSACACVGSENNARTLQNNPQVEIIIENLYASLYAN